MFEIRVVTLAPGRARRYVEAEWRDAFVVVERGEIELETEDHVCWRFARGEMLWLAGLPLRAVHNRGSEPARLVAVSRSPLSEPCTAPSTRRGSPLFLSR